MQLSFIPPVKFSRLALVLLLFVFGCGKEIPIEEAAALPGTNQLFTPVQLEVDSTVVYLEDYFPSGSLPDGIASSSDALQVELRSETKQLVLTENGKPVPSLSVLRLDFNDQHFDLLVKASRKVRHTFRYEIPQDKAPKSVQLAGSMTNWSPDQASFTQGEAFWEYTMALNPGVYQYQLVVDGDWILDPANPETVPNGMGGTNSQLTIEAESEGETPIFSLISSEVVEGISCADEFPEVIVFWNNTQLDTKREAGKITWSLPESAKAEERSHLRFFIAHGRKVEDHLIPLAMGKALQQTSQLTVGDPYHNILYFMLVDRFHNGDSTNDAPLQDERVLPPANYHGGDLAGINAKLEEGYFADLGINTLWISPLNQNPEEAFQEYPEPKRFFSGYHGYWPISSSRVDHRFGSNQELKDLVQSAHSKDTKVILDFVANHVHEQHPLMQNHPDWKTQLNLPDGKTNIRLWDEQRLTTWFDTFLPSLDFSNPEVIETQVDSALFWLDEFGLDGFRHDATKHIPLPFWRRLQQRTKLEVDRPLYQVGETFGSRELIGSYVGTGMLNGQFDFNLYFDLRSAFAADRPNAQAMVNTLNASLDAYGYHSLMGNISGNHDMPRFIAYAGKGLSMQDDPKKVAWSKEIGVPDPVGYDKLIQLHAFLQFIPGVPVIYYGDEIGMSGADDPDNRRDMRFENLKPDELRVREAVKELVGLRKSHLALIYGQTKAFAPDWKTLVVVREYLDEIAILTLNLGDEDRNIGLDPNQVDVSRMVTNSGLKFEEKNGKYFIPVVGHGYAVNIGALR